MSPIPGVPDCNIVPVVHPRNHKMVKRLLTMQHHAIACNYSMINLVVFDPGAQMTFGLIAVSYDYNIERFGCTKLGCGHLVNYGTFGHLRYQ